MICPLLMQGHAASFAISGSDTPKGCMPDIIKGSECVGSECAWWARAISESDEGLIVCTDDDGCPRGCCGMTSSRTPLMTPGRFTSTGTDRDPAWTPPIENAATPGPENDGWKFEVEAPMQAEIDTLHADIDAITAELASRAEWLDSEVKKGGTCYEEARQAAYTRDNIARLLAGRRAARGTP